MRSAYNNYGDSYDVECIFLDALFENCLYIGFPNNGSSQVVPSVILLVDM